MNTHFSSPLKEVISLSREEAIRLHSDVIGTGHLLLVLRPELQKEIEARIVAEQDSAIDAGKARNRGGLPLSGRAGMRLSREAERVIRGAVVVAKDRQSPVVEPEHLMLSILKNTDGKWRALFINPL